MAALFESPSLPLTHLTRIARDLEPEEGSERLQRFIARSPGALALPALDVAIETGDPIGRALAVVVETGTLGQLVRSPLHPYPRGLLASTTHRAGRGQRLETIPGTPPSLDQAPTGCSSDAWAGCAAG